MTVDQKKMGWEVAKDLESEKKTMLARLVPEWRQIRAALGGIAVFVIVFFIGIWLAKNPFDATVRLQSSWVVAHGLTGNEWTIVWSVVILAAFFEFMDASAGMGFGTALTPILLVLGFDPRQIVPVVMIQQGAAGLVGAFLHREFENVEWKFSPMSETVKLWIIIGITGCIAVTVSIFGIYKILQVDKVWIKLYVAVLLLMMGGISVFQSRKERPYRPGRMIGFAALAGFNKGVGGLHHIALEVDDLNEASSRLAAMGAQMLEDEPVDAGDILINFLPPIYTRGVVVEFVQKKQASVS